MENETTLTDGTGAGRHGKEDATNLGAGHGKDDATNLRDGHGKDDATNLGAGQKWSGKRNRQLLAMLVIGLAIAMAILFVVGVLPRQRLTKEAAAYSQHEQEAPQVNIISITPPPISDSIILPADIEAVQQTAVVARASGYVKEWLADIGDKVKAGQTLAIIESPDLDQQVAQARAQLGSSQAAYYQAKAFLSNQQAALAQAQAGYIHSQAALDQSRTQLAQAHAAKAQAQEQSAQQQAQVEQAQANLELARVTSTRYQNLLKDGAIDRQTADQNMTAYETNKANVEALQAAVRSGQENVKAYTAAIGSSEANVTAVAADVRSSAASVAAALANVRSGQADVNAASENIRSSEANLSRYAVLQSFENVTAPFSGEITARNVQTGSMISAGGTLSGGSSSAQPTSLFSIAELDTLRVYVSVPQSYESKIQTGQIADVSVSALGGKVFHARITRNAGSLDAASRTLNTEIDLDNSSGVLRPGMFASVRLTIPHSKDELLIPDSALVSDARGNEVVIADSSSKVHFVPVTVGRDFGQVIEIRSGVHLGQHIVLSPSDALHDGQTIKANYVTLPHTGVGKT